jgi:hypothetical protein
MDHDEAVQFQRDLQTDFTITISGADKFFIEKGLRESIFHAVEEAVMMARAMVDDEVHETPTPIWIAAFWVISERNKIARYCELWEKIHIGYRREDEPWWLNDYINKVDEIMERTYGPAWLGTATATHDQYKPNKETTS